MRANYIDLLRVAASERDVIRLARDYLSEWSPAELAAIPVACRPGHVDDGETLADLAYSLTRARIDSGKPHALLEEMETFFAQACVRISALEALPRRLPPRSYLTR